MSLGAETHLATAGSPPLHTSIDAEPPHRPPDPVVMHSRSPARVTVIGARRLAALMGMVTAAHGAIAGEPPRSDLRPAGEVAAAAADSPVAGVTVAHVPPLLRGHIQLPPEVGLVVRSVTAGSPAERAGLLVHDVLVSLDGRPLKLPEDLPALVAAAGPEAALVLDIRRAGQRRAVALAPSAPSDGETVPPQPGAPAPLASPPPGAAPIRADQPPAGALTAPQAPPFTPPPGARRLGPDVVLLEDRDCWLKVYRAADLCLMARDARGWLVFNGPIATPQQRSLIPRQMRQRVTQLEMMLDAVAVAPPPATTVPAAPPPSAANLPKGPAAPPASAPPPPAAEPVTEIGRLDIDPIEIR